MCHVTRVFSTSGRTRHLSLAPLCRSSRSSSTASWLRSASRCATSSSRALRRGPDTRDPATTHAVPRRAREPRTTTCELRPASRRRMCAGRLRRPSDLIPDEPGRLGQALAAGEGWSEARACGEEAREGREGDSSSLGDAFIRPRRQVHPISAMIACVFGGRRRARRASVGRRRRRTMVRSGRRPRSSSTATPSARRWRPQQQEHRRPCRRQLLHQ